jgi:hypothetical protein
MCARSSLATVALPMAGFCGTRASAIYRSTSETPNSPPIGERDVLFTVGVYDDVPASAACPVVGHDPFESEDEAWPPPSKVVDPITGRIRIYRRGEIVPAQDPAEADKLEKAAVWAASHT